MANYHKYLSEIFKFSSAAIKEMSDKEDGPLFHFMFLMTRKVQKISNGLLHLYPILENSQHIEFNMGILIRSILMDAILFMRLRHFYETNKEQKSFEEMKAGLSNIVNEIYTESANYLIKDVARDEVMTESEKIKRFDEIVKPFASEFEMGNSQPKRKKKKVHQLANIYDETNIPEITERRAFYSLYIQYSKYDHTSHYSGLFKRIESEKLIEKIKHSIILIHTHLQLVLAFAHSFSPSIIELKELILELKELRAD